MFLYILLFILIGVQAFELYYLIFQKEKIEEKLIKKAEEDTADARAKIEKELLLAQEAAATKIENSEKEVEQILNRRKQLTDGISDLIKQGQARVEAETERRKVELNFEFEKEKQKAREQLQIWLTELEQSREEKTKEIEELAAIIDQYRQKQSAINEDIRRKRELEQNEEFYRIVLTEDAKRDIAILRSIRDSLSAREKLDKLIYDVYVAKPTLEMAKRVLKGEDPSGIYKITRLSTGETYVGKSSTIRTRWQSHVKTAMGVDSVARSILHTTMAKDGIDNFTFEVIELVPKEQLSEREKYWIEFYQTKNYGLNERLG